jgi:chorismate--pyruvate lyase
MPLRSNGADWPFFRALGERSIGTHLFSDPKIIRGAFQFARLYGTHPLLCRAYQAIGSQYLTEPLYARRRLFRRRNGVMLITEVFLWTIDNAGPPECMLAKDVKES